MVERDELKTKPGREETEDKYVTATEGHISEGTPLVLLQVNCRSRAIGNLTREDVKYKLLLHTDELGETAWQVAAKYGELDLLQKIWEWAKRNMETGEIKNNLLLDTRGKLETVWQVAARRDKLELFQNIWEWL
jgi:hypothetical protein